MSDSPLYSLSTVRTASPDVADPGATNHSGYVMGHNDPSIDASFATTSLSPIGWQIPMRVVTPESAQSNKDTDTGMLQSGSPVIRGAQAERSSAQNQAQPLDSNPTPPNANGSAHVSTTVLRDINGYTGREAGFSGHSLPEYTQVDFERDFREWFLGSDDLDDHGTPATERARHSSVSPSINTVCHTVTVPPPSLLDVPPNFLTTEFMQSVAGMLDDFDAQRLFTPEDTGINFEQDFREWFNPDNLDLR